MANKRSEIKKRLIEIYLLVSHMPHLTIDEDTRLSNDLLLSVTLQKGLAHTYTRISESYGGKRVSIPEIEKVKTVKDVIELILSKLSES